ncbi:MAG: hypothetical protein ACI8QZ_003696 [Chlamydiales bacterium]|jgi:hypothetical protein
MQLPDRRSARRPRCATLLLALPLLGGCASLPPEPENPITHHAEWGTASASTVADIARLSDAVEQALVVLRPLPGFVDRPLRMHMVKQLERRWAGLTVTRDDGAGYVLIDSGTANLPSIVAHELVHFYFRESNSRFPQLVQEGACELLAHRVFEDDRARDQRCISAALSYLRRYTLQVDLSEPSAILGFYYKDVPTIEQAMQLDAREYLEADARALDAFYGLGWMIVSSIGYEELYSLAERLGATEARPVAPALILTAAGIDPMDDTSVRRGFARMFGLPDADGDAPITIHLSD